MLSPQIAPSRSGRSRVPLVAAAVATVILVPFIIKDAFGSSDGADESEVATVAVTTDPPPTTAPPPDPEEAAAAAAAARIVEVDPDWPAKGTSVFGESETETRARIKERDATLATPELPPATVVSTTRPVGTDGDSDPAAAPTTAARTKSTAPAPPPPAPTAAPTTAPRPTAPPTTAAPTTTAATVAPADG